MSKPALDTPLRATVDRGYGVQVGRRLFRASQTGGLKRRGGFAARKHLQAEVLFGGGLKEERIAALDVTGVVDALRRGTLGGMQFL